jgi:hypothetical protein
MAAGLLAGAALVGSAAAAPVLARAGELRGAQVIGTGFLLVNTVPWLAVSIDGRPVGNTPLVRVPLAHGRHVVVLRTAAGSQETRLVEIRSGETTRLVVRFGRDDPKF